jgi:hypothetical protein
MARLAEAETGTVRSRRSRLAARRQRFLIGMLAVLAAVAAVAGYPPNETGRSLPR